jgi:hypothetical protein
LERQIVDKETGNPLESVVVLPTWYKAYSTPGGWLVLRH